MLGTLKKDMPLHWPSHF